MGSALAPLPDGFAATVASLHLVAERLPAGAELDRGPPRSSSSHPGTRR